MLQRLFDFFLSLLALLVLMPLIIPVAAVLFFSGEGQVFYRQLRVGRHGQIFFLLKFATMLKDSPNLGTGHITIKNDPRVLPFGGFLRRTKINELPQLLNILFGEMSFIGPRPVTSDHFDCYSCEVQDAIKGVRPGLSGVGSIVFRAEEDVLGRCSDPVKFYAEHISPYKGKLEMWYCKNQGILVYLILIFLTIWVIFFPKSSIIWRIFKTLPKPTFDMF